jgi:TRAP-type C4-dicarboxylate transport system permease small subunit
VKALSLPSERQDVGHRPPNPTATPVDAGLASAPPGAGIARASLAVVDRFNDALLLLLSLGLGVLACLAFAQVIFRYVVGQPLVWSEEIIRYALIWTVFLGAGVGVRKGMLASVEIVAQLAPRPVRRALAVAVFAVSGLFWGVLLVYGTLILEAVEGMSSGALEMPMPLVYLAVPVGAAIALVNTVAVAVAPTRPAPEGFVD